MQCRVTGMTTNIVCVNLVRDLYYLSVYTEQKWKRYTTIIYILWESIWQKVFPRHPANDSSKLPHFVSFEVWVMFL